MMSIEREVKDKKWGKDQILGEKGACRHRRWADWPPFEDTVVVRKEKRTLMLSVRFLYLIWFYFFLSFKFIQGSINVGFNCFKIKIKSEKVESVGLGTCALKVILDFPLTLVPHVNCSMDIFFKTLILEMRERGRLFLYSREYMVFLIKKASSSSLD